MYRVIVGDVPDVLEVLVASIFMVEDGDGISETSAISPETTRCNNPRAESNINN
jgi:hypothetical protein